MRTAERLEAIAVAVDEIGFLSVRDLSQRCRVSEVTIRRDLEQLDRNRRIQRTYGGAASLRARSASDPGSHPGGNGTEGSLATVKTIGALADRFDVLVTTSLDPQYDALLPDLRRKAVSLVAESLPVENAATLVAVDSYEAGRALGHWAGETARQRFGGRARVLDLTYHLPNTQARSRGFLDGLREMLPGLQDVLTLNSLSRYERAYQLTHDALLAHRDINVIFAINDTTAWGAINACQDLQVDPETIVVVTFGLEGDTLKDALAAGGHCQAGLAMFPEIVGRVLVEASLAAHARRPLPDQIVTPYAVLTRDTLPMFYTRTPQGWQLRWDAVSQRLAVPMAVDCGGQPHEGPSPKRIGFLVRFLEHEWYRNLIAAMRDHTACQDVEFEVVDAAQTLRDEIELARRDIARRAAHEVAAGDVVLIDGGPSAAYLAEALRGHHDITVVTNANRVLDILSEAPGVMLISTGGALRRSTQVLVGPTTEATLSRLRVDKLFLMVAGVSLDFGLSHTDIAEVTVKQAMMRSAHQVILLADHTCFGHESTIHVAPAAAVHKLIADDALPLSWRLELSKLGIEVTLAEA